MDSVCNRCGKTPVTRPGLKFYITECGHTLCEECRKIVFARGTTHLCNVCKSAMTQRRLIPETGEDPSVKDEIRIRKNVKEKFNAKAEDFNDINEFYAYQERIEDLIYRLSDKQEAKQAQQEIDAYWEENQDDIRRRAERNARELESLDREINEYKAAKLAAADRAFREEHGEEVEEDAMEVDEPAQAEPAHVGGVGGRGAVIAAPQLIAAPVQQQKQAQEALAEISKSKGAKRQLSETEIYRVGGYDATYVTRRAVHEALGSLRLDAMK